MRQPSHARWGIFAGSLLSLAVVLVLGLWGYDRWANTVPPFHAPAVVIPSPNGYSQAAALTRQLPPEPLARFPRWPDGPPGQLHVVLAPVLPTLDAVRATFRLPWRSPPPLGLLASHQKHVWLRGYGRYCIAASLLNRDAGDNAAAMQRALDVMEMAGRATRGQSILTGLEAVAIHQLGLQAAERTVPALPAAAIPSALERVERIRQSWPSFPEFLEAERIYTLADATWTFQQPYHHSTPWDTLCFVGQIAQEAIHSPLSETKDNTVAWLEPKQYALENMDRYMRQIIAESKKPMPQRRPVPMPGDYLSQICLSPMVSLRPTWLWRVQSELAVLEAALAVRKYRLQEGRYPPRLAVIPTQWLSAVLYQSGGQTIGYQLKNGQPVIYYRESGTNEVYRFGSLLIRRLRPHQARREAAAVSAGG